ncbi:MAG TPA: hypothetical protein VJC39_04595 [Candidatus Nanoarchaeia archaeon]|nr:hypothetical protein [Candidatus Nanoarchaeia archaeon]
MYCQNARYHHRSIDQRHTTSTGPRIIKIVSILALFLLFSPLAIASTLQGSIYNSQLELEIDVVVEIDTLPAQKFLSKDGAYTFELPLGKYTLTAWKGFTQIKEEIEIVKEGTFVLDLFLVEDFSAENELWTGTTEEIGEVEELLSEKKYSAWRYAVGGLIVILLIWRIIYYRKKYGSLRKFIKKSKEEQSKTPEQHREDLANEPGYIDRALKIITDHDGRINQKELRKEMLPLSESKVSLIITELEYRGKVEKVKKGRGNVILLK